MRSRRISKRVLSPGHDYNRVVLEALPGVPDSDYINASHIDFTYVPLMSRFYVPKSSVLDPQFSYFLNPTGGHQECMEEELLDKQADSRFPGGHSNGVGLSYQTSMTIHTSFGRCWAMANDVYYDSDVSVRTVEQSVLLRRVVPAA
ncbi:hypothetical protein AVEN_227932-1 [Araneus ventricosus]|uniref:Tyrosine-protein phosphatase domain-containing protein n=1 Tax=Araneus ventricosus TaxID=182803 RepID=A0A4Y2MWU4_ARAVE|nr:hypothetical protein AVEN_236681-1 [Araneus ventricosus]GBN31163.1 hypothetical protein AVEN_227932-1 [Araneus ventricosus]